jgi:circadian clock protein KaiC
MVRFPTGVEGLDAILRGGLLVGGVYIVQGIPGAGKTILANEICYRHVAGGGRAIYVTLLAESHSRMLQHLSSMSFFDESVVPEKLYYVSAFRTLEDEGLKGLLALLRREIRAQRSSLLILDGLVAAEESAPTSRDFKKFIHELQSHAVANDCTILLLTSGADEMVRAEHTMVDGLIELGDQHFDLRTHRTLSVRKFRGSGFLRGKHSFRITSEGIKLFPRLEAAFEWPSRSDAAHGPKIGVGSPSLDRMLFGGLCGSSVTGLVGPTGAGKTMVCLQFLAQASAREPGLFMGFYEPPSRLISKAKSIGQDLQTPIKKGTVEILWQPQGENLLDELGHRLLQAVQTRGVKRLAIDGLGGILASITYPERISRYMACLMNELRALGVTTLFTMESNEIVGPTLRVPVNGISALIENLIFLRFVERDATLSRLISITKMRNGDYDQYVREFSIDNKGVAVGEPLFGLEGSMTGIGRRPNVVASKRASARRAKKK